MGLINPTHLLLLALVLLVVLGPRRLLALRGSLTRALQELQAAIAQGREGHGGP
jgi:Sec-independent protein translocase protein TatA